MDLETEKYDKFLLVSLNAKRLDSSISREFETALNDWIAKGETRILLDLSLVDFMDSSGMGSMVSCLKKLKTGNNGDDLMLCGITEQVLSLFKLTRMDRVFTIFDSMSSAFKALY